MNDVWKVRVDKITYGLIYPAFIGNMVYDLLLRKLAWSDSALVYPNLWTCIAIVIFLIIDYMHLHGDMNEIVKTPERKTWRYILCDITTSMLIFFSFVFIKEDNLEIGVILFTIIPFMILLYKWKNKNSRIYFVVYSLVGTVAACLLQLKFRASSGYSFYIFLYAIGSAFFYMVYISFFYVLKCKDFDIQYMTKRNAKY